MSGHTTQARPLLNGNSVGVAQHPDARPVKAIERRVVSLIHTVSKQGFTVSTSRVSGSATGRQSCASSSTTGCATAATRRDSCARSSTRSSIPYSSTAGSEAPPLSSAGRSGRTSGTDFVWVGSTMPHAIKTLTPETFPAWRALAQKHSGVWGGCYCPSLHGGTENTVKSEYDRATFKQRLVNEGVARTALVFDGDAAIAWCETAARRTARHLPPHSTTRARPTPRRDAPLASSSTATTGAPGWRGGPWTARSS
jgi:hypothetical protein